MDNRLIPDDDYEYEKQLAEQQQKQRKLEESERIAEAERQKELEKQREKRIQSEKIELIKLKSGVIDESESIREQHQQKRELHGMERLSNFWFHNKYIVIFVAFLVLAVGYITYSTLSKVKPDLTVMIVANNGLEYRQEELQAFFEQYTDDVNDDGKVCVSVISAPLDRQSHDELMVSNQSKFIAMLQTADCMLYITDSNSDKQVTDIMKNDLKKDFEDNDYITSQGLSLNMKLFAEQVKFENMPNDVVLSIRNPIATISTSLEDMTKSYNRSFKVFKRIADDLSYKAKESNDPGLETEPLKRVASSQSDN